MNLLMSMLKNACHTSQAHICGLHNLILAQFVSAEADGLLDCGLMSLLMLMFISASHMSQACTCE